MGDAVQPGAEPPRAPPWRAAVLTLFPEMFPGPLGFSLIGRALDQGVWSLKTLDFRDFARDKRGSVDDTPSGGGPGLVLRADIAAAAIDAARAEMAAELGDAEAARVPALFLSPRGRPLTQSWARSLAAAPGVILGCGRFEGVDHRALEARAVEEICVGDAVYTGGEIPAMAVLDATLRLLPGVVGDALSLEEESFAAGLLEHPQYTRPAVWDGRATPEVLLSGDHAKIAAWRRSESERVTKERRPDLWRAHEARAERSDAEQEAPDTAPKE